jgi:predicted RNA-binding Zn ribbon-like protein
VLRYDGTAKVIKIGHTHRTAPGELALVHAFLNTWHADGPRERLDSPERVRDWLAKRSLLPPGRRISRKEFEAVRRLRDALRATIAAGGSATGHRGHEELNALVRNAPLFVKFDLSGRPRLVPGGCGFPAAVARIMAALVAGEAEGNWSRLKVCGNPECQRVFFDTSKNHSAIWCSSQICGNRMAARAYRVRMTPQNRP